MILTIISHTPHFQKDNNVYGWGPTITEINNFSKLFSKIYHIAPLYDKKPLKSSVSYNSKKIYFIPINPRGGGGLKNKIDIILGIPQQLKIINKYCKKSDWVQFRAPTNLGIYVLPYLSYFNKTKYWVKYAGDWTQKSPPLSYRLQRMWLENNFNKSYVTINGKWASQKKHTVSFENPCLTNNELNQARNKTKTKIFSDKLNICFVGSMTPKKGVGILISSLKLIKDSKFIKNIYFIGDGPYRKVYENEAKEIKNMKINFLGALPRGQLNSIYSKSHLIILPSFSEGFPKVIGEASAYGCVPIVSNVGSISQHINNSNGILINKISIKNIYYSLMLLNKNRDILRNMSREIFKISNNFTYEFYIRSLKSKILDL